MTDRFNATRMAINAVHACYELRIAILQDRAYRWALVSALFGGISIGIFLGKVLR